jgi:hypothetical protein
MLSSIFKIITNCNVKAVIATFLLLIVVVGMQNPCAGMPINTL